MDFIRNIILRFTSLSRGIWFPAQSPFGFRHYRWGTCGAVHQRCWGQASHVPAD